MAVYFVEYFSASVFVVKWYTFLYCYVDTTVAEIETSCFDCTDGRETMTLV